MVDSGELVGQPGPLPRWATPRAAIDDSAHGAGGARRAHRPARAHATSTCCRRSPPSATSPASACSSASVDMPADELRKSLRRLRDGRSARRAHRPGASWRTSSSIRSRRRSTTRRCCIERRRELHLRHHGRARRQRAESDVLARHALQGEAWEQALTLPLREAGRPRDAAVRRLEAVDLFRARARGARTAPCRQALAREPHSTCTCDLRNALVPLGRQQPRLLEVLQAAAKHRRRARRRAPARAGSVVPQQLLRQRRPLRTSRSRRASARSSSASASAPPTCCSPEHERGRDPPHARQLPEGAASI